MSRPIKNQLSRLPVAVLLEILLNEPASRTGLSPTSKPYHKVYFVGNTASVTIIKSDTDYELQLHGTPNYTLYVEGNGRKSLNDIRDDTIEHYVFSKLIKALTYSTDIPITNLSILQSTLKYLSHGTYKTLWNDNVVVISVGSFEAMVNLVKEEIAFKDADSKTFLVVKPVEVTAPCIDFIVDQLLNAWCNARFCPSVDYHVIKDYHEQ